METFELVSHCGYWKYPMTELSCVLTRPSSKKLTQARSHVHQPLQLADEVLSKNQQSVCLSTQLWTIRVTGNLAPVSDSRRRCALDRPRNGRCAPDSPRNGRCPRLLTCAKLTVHDLPFMWSTEGASRVSCASGQHLHHLLRYEAPGGDPVPGHVSSPGLGPRASGGRREKTARARRRSSVADNQPFD